MSRLGTVILVGLVAVFPLLTITDAVAASLHDQGDFGNLLPVTFTAATTWKVASYKPPKKPPPKRSTGTGTR